MPVTSEPETPPAALDALRGSRSGEYFRVLFSLPEAAQYAEMSTWAEEDHAAAAKYLGVRCEDCADEAAADGELDIGFPTAPPSAFDEEDHFG